jgi:hypothetical protein
MRAWLSWPGEREGARSRRVAASGLCRVRFPAVPGELGHEPGSQVSRAGGRVVTGQGPVRPPTLTCRPWPERRFTAMSDNEETGRWLDQWLGDQAFPRLPATTC